MRDEELLIEVAKLDGWRVYPTDNPCRFQKAFPSGFSDLTFDAICVQCPYLTSRDAIVPVIEKHFKDADNETLYKLWTALDDEDENEFFDKSYLFATPRQLCIALLKATGRF